MSHTESSGRERTQHPRNPRLVLHVGITGHRPPRLAAAARPDLQETIQGVLVRVASQLAELSGGETAGSSGDQKPLIRVISSLAEGADWAAARAAFGVKAEVQCPLPFHKEEYAKDFLTEASRREFHELLGIATAVLELDGSRDDEEGAYLEAGRVMLEQSDVLIAVWDGQPARGRGGTAEIVSEALAGGKLVLQIRPDQPKTVRIFGRNPESPWEEALRKELRRLMVGEAEPDSRLRRYLSEKERRSNWGWFFTVFRNLVWCGRFSGGPWKGAPYLEETEAQWAEDWRKHSELPEAVESQIDHAFRDHYAWADHLAIAYAGRFRSAYLGRYVLYSIAIVLTAYGFYARGPNWHNWLGFFGHLVFLSGVCALIVGDKLGEWHRRSLEYRILAEQLRVQRFQFPLGRGLSALATAEAGMQTTPGWIARHLRRIVREAGLVSAEVNRAYLKNLRRYLVEAELKPQIDYHEKSSVWQDCLQKRLYFAAMTFFVIGVIVFAARLLAYQHWPNAANGTSDSLRPEPPYAPKVVLWIKVCSVVFPALGAMFAGIRSHGEFKRLAARSSAMRRFHEKQMRELESGSKTSWEETVRISGRIATEMLAEVTDWRTVIEGKGLSFPP